METEVYDFCIVGLGANGGLLARLLAERGFSVVGLEAGPRYDPQRDLVNDEAEMLKLFWNEPRTAVGKDPAAPGCGFGVGGGTLLWCAVAPRMHASDFRIRTTDGLGVDWPISYADLAPYYDIIEREFGVCGDSTENHFGEPRGPYPMPPIAWSWANQQLAIGVRNVGATPIHGPLAIASTEYRGRKECNKCGFCMTGCRSTAKSCTLTGFVPDAESHGARIVPDAFVFNITYERGKNRVTGVEYLDVENRVHAVESQVVIVAAHTIESTRLLLLSANPTFPEGLANASGLVGKNYMLHWDFYVYGVMEERMNAYKGPILGNLMVQDYSETDPKRGFARGYVLESSLPQPYYFGVAGPPIWGAALKEMIRAYDHMIGWWVAGEGLPHEENTISLDQEVRDHRGLPVARLSHEWTDNDRAAMRHGGQKAVEILEGAGALKTHVGTTLSAHPMGTARMGTNTSDSVVNSYCQTHDIPNLFICDPSVFPTGGSVNNTLTSMAITARAVDYMCDAAKRGDFRAS